jgi:hypothetical protein
LIGALAVVAGALLLATGSLRLSSLLTPRSSAAFLLGAYVIAWTQLVVVLWALSLFGWVTRPGLLVGLALVSAALAFDTRGWSGVGARLGEAAAVTREALADPVCAVLGIVVVAVLAYAVALGLATPQNDFDTLVDHLWRAGLWLQNRSVGYPDCACAAYINAYPPHGEMGVLSTMVLGGADRYVGLVQASAYVALVVGVVGVSRGLGLGRREAVFGALLVATLPVIALQASTAQNDLLVASFLVAAAVLLLARGRGTALLAGGATALALGTKLTAVIGIPVLLVIAVAAAPHARRGPRLAAVLAGSAAGAYWYVVNWRHTGSWDGGFPDEQAERGALAAVARGLRSTIQLVELPGAVGRDRWLYVVTAACVLVGLALVGRRRGRSAVATAVVAAAIVVLPVLVPDARRYLDQAYLDLWRAVGRDDLAVSPGRDFVLAASNVTWYGPLGAMFVVVGIVVAVVAARRGWIARLGVILVLAPLYWIGMLSALLFYQDAAGRFLMAPMALAGATWGVVLRWRALAWGAAGIAVTAAVLAVLHDSKRPSGVALLERPAPAGYWSEPRWRAQGGELHIPDLVRFVDERVPAGARIALGITASDAGYPFFGRDLDRRLDLLTAGATDAQHATWAFVSPSARSVRKAALCARWHRLDAEPSRWWVYRRTAGRC